MEINFGEGLDLQLTEKFKQTSVQRINFFNCDSAHIVWFRLEKIIQQKDLRFHPCTGVAVKMHSRKKVLLSTYFREISTP